MILSFYVQTQQKRQRSIKVQEKAPTFPPYSRVQNFFDFFLIFLHFHGFFKKSFQSTLFLALYLLPGELSRTFSRVFTFKSKHIFSVTISVTRHHHHRRLVVLRWRRRSVRQRGDGPLPGSTGTPAARQGPVQAVRSDLHGAIEPRCEP